MDQARITLSNAVATDQIQNRTELTSDLLFRLAADFSLIAGLFLNEENRILESGVTADEQEKFSAITLIRIRAENLSRHLSAIAFTARINVELENYTAEITRSTEQLKAAARRIQGIRDTIGNFVEAFGFVLDVVGRITSGGFFTFDGVFSTVTGFLELAGVTV